jgi:predicted XRE-type DNA-binding protein
MNQIPIKTFLETTGISQKTLAKSVGLAQSAISKMIKTERNIFVLIREGGVIELREEKTVAKSK